MAKKATASATAMMPAPVRQGVGTSVGRGDAGERGDADRAAGLLHGLEHSRRGAGVRARGTPVRIVTLSGKKHDPAPMPKRTSGPNRLSK